MIKEHLKGSSKGTRSEKSRVSVAGIGLQGKPGAVRAAKPGVESGERMEWALLT